MMAAILLALGTVVASAKNRAWFLVVAVFAALATSQEWQLGVVARPEVFFCVALISISALRRSAARAPNANLNILAILILWLSYATIISLAFAPRPADSLSLILWFALSSSALWWIPRLGLEPRTIVRIGTGIVVAHALFAVGAWLLAQTGGANYFVFLDLGDSNFRARGITLEPNILGSTSVAWIAVIYYWRQEAPRWVLLSTIPIAVAGVTSLTRTTIACLLLIAAIIAMRNLSSFVRGVIIAAICTPIVLAVAGSSILSAQGRVASLLSFSDFSTGTGAFRAKSWSIALDELGEGTSWLFGFGMNSFPQKHEAFVNAKSLDYLSNFWITVLYDTGFIGSTILAFAFLAIVRTTERKFDALPFFASLAVAQSVTSTSWLLFTWLTIAVVLMPSNALEEDAEPAASKRARLGSQPPRTPSQSLRPIESTSPRATPQA